MDGAIILAADASRIARANVHLVPEPERAHVRDRHPPPHRRAGGPLDRRPGDRRCRSDMTVITVYVGDDKHPLEPTPASLNRANQALSDPRALQATASTRCRLASPPSRSRTSSRSATWSPCCSAPRWCAASPRRSSATSSSSASDGRLVRLQLEELMGGVGDDRRLVVRDYFHATRTGTSTRRWRRSPSSPPRTCSTSKSVAAMSTCGRRHRPRPTVQPRGYRLLAKIPRLPEADRRAHRRPLRQPPEDHAGHDRRPRRGRRRGRDPGPGHQGRPDPPGREPPSSTATAEPHGRAL